MKVEGESVVLFPEGRIDANSAPALDAAIRAARAQYPGKSTVLDFGRVLYISSAGLRVLLGASRQPGESLSVRNVPPEVYDIFDMTGFTELMRVERQLRQIDLTGCEIIGEGALGVVWRIDSETIVKVYNDVPGALDMIRNEQRRAKQAFLKGVPTAISYDAVRVGDRYGSVFEMIDAKTFNDLLIAHPEREDAIVREYAGFINKVHAIQAEPSELPDCRETFLGYLDQLTDVLPAALCAQLRARFEAMGEDLHLIHGDFHMKNVMLSNGEPLLIDMDTLSVGNPVFDFASLFVAYDAFCRDDPDNSMRFLHIPCETSLRLWRAVLAHCLNEPEGKALQRAVNRVMIVGYVRFLYLLYMFKFGNPALHAQRMRAVPEALAKLLAEEDGLEI